MKSKSLGVARRSMPQIDSKYAKDFIKFLKNEHYVDVKETKMKVSKLKPTQKEFDPNKAIKLLDAPDTVLKKPIFVTKDNYILDGTHRWISLYMNNSNDTIPVYQIQTSIRMILNIAKDFDKVSFKKVSESVEE